MALRCTKLRKILKININVEGIPLEIVNEPMYISSTISNDGITVTDIQQIK